jgi:hypothetical protein
MYMHIQRKIQSLYAHDFALESHGRPSAYVYVCANVHTYIQQMYIRIYSSVLVGNSLCMHMIALGVKWAAISPCVYVCKYV